MKNKQKKMLCTHPMQGYKQNPANQLDNNAIYFFSAARKEKKEKKKKLYMSPYTRKFASKGKKIRVRKE